MKYAWICYDRFYSHDVSIIGMMNMYTHELLGILECYFMLISYYVNDI